MGRWQGDGRETDRETPASMCEPAPRTSKAIDHRIFRRPNHSWPATYSSQANSKTCFCQVDPSQLFLGGSIPSEYIHVCTLHHLHVLIGSLLAGPLLRERIKYYGKRGRKYYMLFVHILRKKHRGSRSFSLRATLRVDASTKHGKV